MKYIGIWIDHRKAVVVHISNAVEQIQTILADEEVTNDGSVDSPKVHHYTSKDFVAEDKLEHREMNHLNRFYDQVIGFIQDADTIAIMGPGEAKLEFKKRVVAKKLKGHLVPLETKDKMTDPQIAAHVRQLANVHTTS